MKVSIITVCYNSEKTIEDTIKSVVSQNYHNIEYIVVDGGSSDDTLKIIERNRKHIDILISEPDEGIYDAMNKGIKVATGDIVGILNSDDFFSSDESIKYIAKGFSSEVDAVYGDLKYVKQYKPDLLSRVYSSAGFKLWKVRFGFMVPHPTFYARKHLFEKYGYYKLDYRVAADFELMVRFFLNGIKFRRIDKMLVSMREGGISSSGLKWRIHQNAEIVRACRENQLYTNLALVAVKLPFKLFSFFKKEI